MLVYIAGPMRGLPNWNFESFDRAEKLWREAGHTPMSPASIDRAMGIKPGEPECQMRTRRAMQFDIVCLYSADAIALLPGWEESKGSTVELALAEFLGLKVYQALTGMEIKLPPLPWRLLEKLAREDRMKGIPIMIGPAASGFSDVLDLRDD